MTSARQGAAGTPAKAPQRRRARGRMLDGILLLDKPVGMTSNRALQIAKRLFDANKAGHTGSLDPLASGMLPVCFGHATKTSSWLLDANKTYEVVAAIGVRTDTADADGSEIECSPVTEISEPQLEAALTRFRGDIMQVPPMYSALKKDGRRLYELARAGQEVERAARPVTIHQLEIQAFDPAAPRLRVHCSKGTYVRTLVEDIAAAMGTVAHVSELRRTAVEPFGGQPMVTLAALEALNEDAAAKDALLLPVDAALQAFPAVYLEAGATFYISNGHAVNAAGTPSGGLVRLYDPNRVLLGIGEVNEDGLVAPKRLFPRPSR